MTIEARAVANRGCAGAPPVHLPVRTQAPRTAPSLRILAARWPALLRRRPGGGDCTAARPRPCLLYVVLTPGMKETAISSSTCFRARRRTPRRGPRCANCCSMVANVGRGKNWRLRLRQDACQPRRHAHRRRCWRGASTASGSERAGRPASSTSGASPTHSMARLGQDRSLPSADWLCVKREHLHQLGQSTSWRRSSPPPRMATRSPERIAHTLLQVDPTHAIACQTLMRACVSLGNIGSSFDGLQSSCWEFLEREYDVEPSAAAKALVVAIKRGHNAPAATGFAARLGEARYAA